MDTGWPLRDGVLLWTKANGIAVIARNALAQEESQDFNPDFPETIPINIGENEQGCSC